MKLLFIFFGAGFMMLALGAAAQQPDTAQVLVHYKFLHIRDTTNRKNPYTNEMVLQIGKSASVYKSSATTGFKSGGSEYYQFPHEKKIVRKESIISANFQISEILPVINWKITADTANFGGLHCQKATAHFKGRNYIAWFCPDIPLPAGPWKLNGLPGIIIEACDSKKEVCFTFEGIENLGSGKERTIIKVPTNLTLTTEKEFTKLQETFRKDPDAFIRMITAQGDGSGRQMHMDIKPGPPPVINNPIELPEKK